ncbi:MAG: hypothetical protein ACTSPH_05220 [Promethearchaeota archaeon]
MIVNEVEFKIKVKKRRIAQLFLLIIIVILLSITLYYFHNYIETITSGEFIVKTSGSKILTNGTGIVDAKMTANYDNRDRYDLSIIFSVRSNGNIIPIGFNFSDLYFYKNQLYYNHEVNIISPPQSYYYKNFIVELKKNDNFTCMGKVNALFLSKGSNLIQNASIRIKLMLILPCTISSAYYNIKLPAIWGYILIISIICYFFYTMIKIIKRIHFEKFYTKEMKKKDDEFQNYIIKWKKEILENQTSE